MNSMSQMLTILLFNINWSDSIYLLMSICLIAMRQGEESELPKDVLAPAEGPRENLVCSVTFRFASYFFTALTHLYFSFLLFYFIMIDFIYLFIFFITVIEFEVSSGRTECKFCVICLHHIWTEIVQFEGLPRLRTECEFCSHTYMGIMLKLQFRGHLILCSDDFFFFHACFDFENQ